MPSIRAIFDFGRPTEREMWVSITDYTIDKDGYLSLFRLHFTDGSVGDYHLYRRNTSLLNIAAGLFGSATSLRSAKGLLEDMSSLAEALWRRKPATELSQAARDMLDKVAKQRRTQAGVVGLVIGSAALLHEFLAMQPFREEGYYDASARLFLNRTIHTGNAKDYDPD